MTIKQQGGIFGRNPSFNDLEAEQATVNGQVNIQSNRPQIFLHEQDRTDNNARIECSFDNLNISQVDDSNGSPVVRLTVEMDTGDVYVNDGNLVIGTSGKGIDFSATSGTGTSELFDDYEEGTWTPVPSDATSGGNVGTGTISGLYTKVGNIVTAQFRIVNLNTTGMTAGNALRIQGLPFTSLSGSGNFVGSLDVQNVTFSDGISLQNSSGQSYLTLRELASSGAGSNLIVSDFASGSADVFGSITYTAA